MSRLLRRKQSSSTLTSEEKSRKLNSPKTSAVTSKLQIKSRTTRISKNVQKQDENITPQSKLSSVTRKFDKNSLLLTKSPVLRDRTNDSLSSLSPKKEATSKAESKAKRTISPKIQMPKRRPNSEQTKASENESEPEETDAPAERILRTRGAKLSVEKSDLEEKNKKTESARKTKKAHSLEKSKKANVAEKNVAAVERDETSVGKNNVEKSKASVDKRKTSVEKSKATVNKNKAADVRNETGDLLKDATKNEKGTDKKEGAKNESAENENAKNENSKNEENTRKSKASAELTRKKKFFTSKTSEKAAATKPVKEIRKRRIAKKNILNDSSFEAPATAETISPNQKKTLRPRQDLKNYCEQSKLSLSPATKDCTIMVEKLPGPSEQKVPIWKTVQFPEPKNKGKDVYEISDSDLSFEEKTTKKRGIKKAVKRLKKTVRFVQGIKKKPANKTVAKRAKNVPREAKKETVPQRNLECLQENQLCSDFNQAESNSILPPQVDFNSAPRIPLKSALARTIETNLSRRIESKPGSSRQIEAPSRKIEAPSRKVEAPSRKINAPSLKIEVPSRKIDAPSSKIESAAGPSRIESNRKSEVHQKPKVVSVTVLGEKNKVNLVSPKAEAPKEFRPFRVTQNFHPRSTFQHNMSDHSLLSESMSPIARTTEKVDLSTPWRMPQIERFSRVRNLVQSTPQSKPLSDLWPRRNTIFDKLKINEIKTNDVKTNDVETNIKRNFEKKSMETNNIKTKSMETNNIKTNTMEMNNIKTNTMEMNNIKTNTMDKNNMKTNTIETNVKTNAIRTSNINEKKSNSVKELSDKFSRIEKSSENTIPYVPSPLGVDNSFFDDAEDKENAAPNKQSPSKYSNNQSPLKYSNNQSPLKYSNKQSPSKYSNNQSPLKYSNKHSPLKSSNCNLGTPVFEPQPGPSGLQNQPLRELRLLRQTNLNNFLNLDDTPERTEIRAPHGIFNDMHSTPINGKFLKRSQPGIQNAFGFDDDEDVDASPIDGENERAGRVEKGLFRERRGKGKKSVSRNPVRFSAKEILRTLHENRVKKDGDEKAKVDRWAKVIKGEAIGKGSRKVDEKVTKKVNEKVTRRGIENVVEKGNENVAEKANENVAKKANENGAKKANENVMKRANEEDQSEMEEIERQGRVENESRDAGGEGKEDESYGSYESDDDESLAERTQRQSIDFDEKKKKQNFSNLMDTFDLLEEQQNENDNGKDESTLPLFADLEPPTHFVAPPKSIYKRKRDHHFSFSGESDDDENSSVVKEVKHKRKKRSKKADKELKEWAKNINKTFEEIDNFDLLVE